MGQIEQSFSEKIKMSLVIIAPVRENNIVSVLFNKSTVSDYDYEKLCGTVQSKVID